LARWGNGQAEREEGRRAYEAAISLTPWPHEAIPLGVCSESTWCSCVFPLSSCVCWINEWHVYTR
jgi:hypothetical protein